MKFKREEITNFTQRGEKFFIKKKPRISARLPKRSLKLNVFSYQMALDKKTLLTKYSSLRKKNC